MLEGLIEYFNKFSTLNESEIIHNILEDKTLQAEIVDLNQHQLYDEGVQSDGSETGQYALKTIKYKEAYGDSRGIPGNTAHITGNNTGVTYDSMRVQNNDDNFLIIAEDRNDFFKREPEGLGLTEESVDQIKPAIIEGMIERIKAL